jgi:FkbM family methyltransferase
MKKIASSFKKYVPAPIWQGIRAARDRSVALARNVGPAIRTIDHCGIALRYNRGNAIIRRLKKEKSFEREMCEAIVKELQKGKPGKEEPVFLDIGANIGLVSAYVISKMPAVTIHAFEPGPAQRSLLEMTVRENRLTDRVSIHAHALGREAGEMTLHVHEGAEMGKDSLRDTGRGGGSVPIAVRVETLDAWWKKAGKPAVSVIKIDTEGAELWVLQGGREFLAASKPVIFMEIEPLNLRAFPYDQSDILAFLDSIGYGLFTLKNEAVAPENFDAFIKERQDTFSARPRA